MELFHEAGMHLGIDSQPSPIFAESHRRNQLEDHDTQQKAANSFGVVRFVAVHKTILLH